MVVQKINPPYTPYTLGPTFQNSEQKVMNYLLIFLTPPPHCAVLVVMQIHLKGLLSASPPPVPFKRKGRDSYDSLNRSPAPHPSLGTKVWGRYMKTRRSEMPAGN